MEKYRYEAFISSKCCNLILVEDVFNREGGPTRTGLYCPKCLTSDVYEIGPWYEWSPRAEYIMASEEKRFVRTVEESELIKKHGIWAYWFQVGRRIYIDPVDRLTNELKEFKKKDLSGEKILVYFPNSHLQRLYFMVPKDAIT